MTSPPPPAPIPTTATTSTANSPRSLNRQSFLLLPPPLPPPSKPPNQLHPPSHTLPPEPSPPPSPSLLLRILTHPYLSRLITVAIALNIRHAWNFLITGHNAASGAWQQSPYYWSGNWVGILASFVTAMGAQVGMNVVQGRGWKDLGGGGEEE